MNETCDDQYGEANDQLTRVIAEPGQPGQRPQALPDRATKSVREDCGAQVVPKIQSALRPGQRRSSHRVAENSTRAYAEIAEVDSGM